MASTNKNNSEFSLHVHRTTGPDRQTNRYTIGLWNGIVLRAICHIEPLDNALAALRLVLEDGASEGDKKSVPVNASVKTN
jgi:hypothetical protein